MKYKNLVLILFIAFFVFGCTQTPTGPVSPLAWEAGHPERAPWSQNLNSLIKDNLSVFSSASDVSSLCKNYSSLSDEQKINVIATMVAGIAKYESAYDPACVYHEPPPLSVDSIGLFQLSYEDKMGWCDMDKSQNTLKDPNINIQCAIGEMAKLVKSDGVIAGENPYKGLTRYWSTIRSKGHKASILALTNALIFCAK